MCGIAGFSLDARASRVEQTRVARALLLGIEPRGRDATGVAWSTDTNEVWFQKTNVRASTFVDFKTFDTTGARALIAHTRYATQGSPTINDNNHPIVVPGIVGVHNGHIHNDGEIFDMLECERVGIVDSEAAYALLSYGPDVWSGVTAPELLTLIDGGAALAWIRTDDPAGTLHLARVSSSPLVIATTRRGSLLFASTRDALDKAARAGGFSFARIVNVPERTYLRVESGKVVEVTQIPGSSHSRAFRSTGPHALHVEDFEGEDDWRRTYTSPGYVVNEKRYLRELGHKPYTPTTSGRSKTSCKSKTQREPFPDFDPDDKALS